MVAEPTSSYATTSPVLPASSSFWTDNNLHYMHKRIKAFTRVPNYHCWKHSKSKNFPKEILLWMAITRFWGLPVGVAEDPILALEARANKNGWGGKLCRLAIFRTNLIKTTQEVSLVKKALEIVEIRQIRQSKSLGPMLLYESNLPKYLDISALSRKTLTTIVPKSLGDRWQNKLGLG